MRSPRPVPVVALTICSLVALALVSLLVSRQTAFAIVREITLNGLSLQSDVIVVGTVADANSFWQDGEIYTDVTVSVDQTIKGDPSQTKITVRQPGGRVGDIWEWVEDAPDFAVGERAVLFLERREVPTFGLVGAFQGKLAVQNDKVFVEGSYVPLSTLLGRVSTILDGGDAQPQQPTPQAPLAACTIGSITPSRAPAGTGSTVDISGSNFDTAGTVTFFRDAGNPPIETSWAAGGWGAALIDNVIVPGNWDYGASSGPVTVDPASADPCSQDFEVTFSYNGNKWPGAWPTVTVHVNPNTADTANEKAAVAAAATTWNGEAAFSFLVGADTAATGKSQNGQNEVMWVTGPDCSLDGAWLASTSCWVWGAPGPTVGECDIAFNDSCLWRHDGDPLVNRIDVQSVAVHEFGHFLTLNDLYGTADSSKIMYGELGPGTVKRTLHADDKGGIRHVYPQSVGGIAELPEMASDSGWSAGTYAALAAGLTAAALAAGAWYGRRRWAR